MMIVITTNLNKVGSITEPQLFCVLRWLNSNWRGKQIYSFNKYMII